MPFAFFKCFKTCGHRLLCACLHFLLKQPFPHVPAAGIAAGSPPPCRARSPRLPASGLAWLPASSLAPLPARLELHLATALGRQKAMGDGCAARSSMGPKPKATADPLQQSSQSALQPSSRAHLLDRERPPPRPWGTSGWQSPRGDPRMWRRSHMSWRQTCGQRRLLLRHRRQCRRSSI